MLKFYHCNHSVRDINKSCEFYNENFGLKKFRDISAYDGDMRLVFLGEKYTDFRLELTWYRNHPQEFDQGDKEFHVAFYTDDYDRILEKHRSSGIVVKEEPELRLYYVEDPDGYQIEIVEISPE